MNSVGERLKSLRVKMKMTLKTSGEALGVTINTIYRWENNMTFPRANTMMRIAEYYDVPVEWLRNGIVDGDKSVYIGGEFLLNDSNEQQLINMYRKLPSNSRYQVLGYIECMLAT